MSVLKGKCALNCDIACMLLIGRETIHSAGPFYGVTFTRRERALVLARLFRVDNHALLTKFFSRCVRSGYGGRGYTCLRHAEG